MSHPTQRWDLSDGGQLQRWEAWIDPPESDLLFKRLSTELPWAQQEIRIAGRTVPMPRLTAWIGDPTAVYTYSGLTNQPYPWPDSLTNLRKRLTEETELEFNSVLANLYRDAKDSMGWHADREKELGRNPVVASISLGATRKFRLQHRQQKDLRVDLDLKGGDLLLMTGTTQHFWKHSVPKSRHPVGPRINLTFRRVLSGQARAEV